MTNVIFDTNAIRDFIAGVKIEELESFSIKKAKELDSKNLRVLISPIVVFELLSHLVNSNDKKYSISYKALKTLMLIDEIQSHGGQRYIMKPAELLIAHEIYNMRCESRELMYEQWMTIAEMISHGSINEIPDLRTHDGENIMKYVEDIEKGFVEQIRKIYQMVLMMANFHNVSFKEEMDHPQIEEFMITYFSRTTYNLLIDEGKVPDYHEFFPQFSSYTRDNHKKTLELIDNMKKGNREIIRRYPAALALMKKVLFSLHINGSTISDERLKNFVWDIRLMFHVNDHTIDKNPFIFVTSDTSMIKAIDAFKNKYIFSLKDFKKKYSIS